MTLTQILIFVIPCITYPLISLSFVYVLKQKRTELKNLLERSDALKAYVRFIDEEGLFRQYYNWKQYILPLILVMLVGMILVIAIEVRTEILPAGSDKMLEFLKNLPLTAVMGMVGAYLWTHYDMLQRFYIIDLTAVRIYYFWLRFLVSGILAYFFGLTLQNPYNLIVAIAIGAFPISTLNNILRTQARSKLGITDEVAKFEDPNLHLLQGMTKNVIRRLNEENIFSIQQLSLTNPIKLFMKTSLQWTVILDLIDQALLYISVGDKIEEIRTTGIRCVLELSGLQEDIDANDPVTVALVSTIAVKIGWDEPSVKNMISTLAVDPQVILIDNLYAQAYPKP